jgi:hypothetical protein
MRYLLASYFESRMFFCPSLCTSPPLLLLLFLLLTPLQLNGEAGKKPVPPFGSTAVLLLLLP